MRKKLIAGNWKMNLLFTGARDLFVKLNEASINFSDEVEVMIAPPAPYLSWLAGDSTGRLAVGAQDISAREEAQGAFTGEFSAEMLKSIGAKYAIVGHSERRSYHGETDEVIRRKIAACLRGGIAPVYCCGEVLEEREAGRHIEVVSRQVETALRGFNADELAPLVIAYEPVWAIGTGKTASAAQAQEMHAEIRQLVAKILGKSFAERLRILYGGSLKPQNADELFAQPDIDGGLIGGASLVAADFLSIVESGTP